MKPIVETTSPQYVRCVHLNIRRCNAHSLPAFRRRLFAWTCPSECDYACQHIVTTTRVLNQFPVLQYHGKWPFYRFLGMQEPFSVLFSVLNLLAHIWGVSQLREKIPPTYPLRRYYILFGYFGFSSWMASILFHIRDFTVTEKADYFAAGANVLYGLYSAAIRIFRLDDPERKRPWKREALQIWTGVCIGLYTCHISYLTFWKFDYAYNMTANISVGIVHNLLWTAFAWNGWVKKRRWWQAWPGMIVAWIILAMSMELLDFPPWRLMIDAHSLWHLGTVGPTWWWYK